MALLKGGAGAADSRNASNAQSIGKTKDQVKVLARQVATHKEAFHGEKEPLLNTDARIAVMQKVHLRI